MTPGGNQPIENISDTARWIAAYRAAESERPDRLFHDPYAGLLAGPRGEEILRSIPGARALGWVISTRTHLLDELIAEVLSRSGVDTVLNLAAGLDARPYRLKLSPMLHWIEVDLPGILSYKEQVLAGEHPECRLERVRLNLGDAAARREYFGQVATSSTETFVLTEGLLVYLKDDQVRSFAKDLHAQEKFKYWAIDLFSPQTLALLQRIWGARLEAANARFHFGVDAIEEFFLPLGWKPVKVHSILEESRRLRRQPKLMTAWHWALKLSSREKREAFNNLYRVVLLERT